MTGLVLVLGLVWATSGEARGDASPSLAHLLDPEVHPGETTDLSSEYPEIAKGLALELRKWQASVPARQLTGHDEADTGEGK